ncbi:MAG: topoisomerase DNA-binding C4 zinc finger domain-containing protein [Clostridia bacterium]|nr:topoisomerase DNA-binding C4 zinc finger domain-containing protein [Bacilli bacterium]MBR3511536.1 topoisomerase DNA-binding C4 zinc finger domain-containing protein [Clostridia bacterium]
MHNNSYFEMHYTIILLIFSILGAIIIGAKKKKTKIITLIIALALASLIIWKTIPSGHRILYFVVFAFVYPTILFLAYLKSYFRESSIKNYKDPREKLKEEIQILLEEQKDDPDPKYCPKCGARMVFTKQLLNNFYSCSNYPECKYYEKLDKYKKIDEL